ncbi:MAG: tRNA (adenosine(37)-N6)-threonylcarbamoyltransferase complex transferase subunit TsaD [Candidatus Omnitrophica bacterium]|nr:tRNA (adenosine(37)-N6)-threonylcarbamoyltransferase complex transferase subunit TsaD [Candidatus Omnitrophota bacterium]
MKVSSASDLLTLGIETSCDETGVCVLKGRKVLAEALASSAPLHSRYGGVVPEMASRDHLEKILGLLDRALTKARVRPAELDLVAATGGPGLLGSLLVGTSAAKALALSLNKPLVFVDHVLAHAYTGAWLLGEGIFPFVALVVSGGHTVLFHWRTLNDVRVIGRTTDDAAGEAFDKTAKLLGLNYPGGPEIERLARKGNPAAYRFPRPRMDEDNYDFSFSGLKTSVFYRVRDLSAHGTLPPSVKRDLAASFQEAACDVLCAKAIGAARRKGVRTLVVGGGVSVNRRLRDLLVERSGGLRVVFPTNELCVDNAVMTAALGQAMVRSSRRRSSRRPLDFKAYSDFFKTFCCPSSGKSYKISPSS